MDTKVVADGKADSNLVGLERISVHLTHRRSKKKRMKKKLKLTKNSNRLPLKKRKS
jgi:hypothetical protein